jgi:hypothetical protein
MNTKLNGRLALAVFVMAVVCSAAQAGGAHVSMRTFEKLYADMKIAMESKDERAISALLAPGFASEDVSGKVESKDQMLAELDELPGDPNRKASTTVLAVDAAGASAIVTQRYHMTSKKMMRGGSPASIELTTVSTDTWKRIGNAWRMSRTVTEKMDYAVNGQNVVHKSHD